MSFDHEDGLGEPAQGRRAPGDAGRQGPRGPEEAPYTPGGRNERPGGAGTVRGDVNAPDGRNVQPGGAGMMREDVNVQGGRNERPGGAGAARENVNVQSGRGYAQGGGYDPSEERRIQTRKALPPERESFSSKVARMREEVNRKKRRKRRIIAMVLAECLVLVGIFSYAHMSRLWNLMPKPSVSKENVENPNISVDAITKMKGYWMVAIFGIDAGTGTSSSRGNSSDVNMIACVNQDTGEIKLVSLYRDTYLKVNDRGTYRKFNYAYSEGGPEQALKMLNENLDLNITEYIIFNWKAVADGINILGGVDMDISKAEFKYINAFITETVEETGVGSHHLQSAGMNHLDGIQAVAYGRLRLMDSDYKRVERQKKVIEQAMMKAKQADYTVLNNILVVCLQEVMTNLDFEDLTNAALNMNKYYLGETTGFPFELSEANLGKARGSCIIPQTLESNVSQLHQFLFGDEIYEPTEAVKSISQKISSDSGVYAEQSRQTSTTAASETQQPDTGDSSETKDGTREDDGGTDENGETISPQPGETDENGEWIDPQEPDEWEWNGEYGPGGGPGSTGNGPGTGPGYSSPDGDTPSGPWMPGVETRPEDADGQNSEPGGANAPGESSGVIGPGGGSAPGGDRSDPTVTSPAEGDQPGAGGPGGGSSTGPGGGSAAGPSGNGNGAFSPGGEDENGAPSPGGENGNDEVSPGGENGNDAAPGPGDDQSPTVAAGPG